MSTKVYRAFRLRKNGDFWGFVADTRERGVKEVQKVLRSLHKDISANVTKEAILEYRSGSEYRGGLPEEKVRSEIAWDIMRKEYRAQVSKSERNPFDFDVAITFRKHKGRIYLIPYCDWLMRDVLNFLDKDERLEDYAYWNNTDRAEGVSQRAWDSRGKVWDEMDKNWQVFLSLDICNMSAYTYIDPSYEEMLQKFRRASKKS